MPRRPIVRPHPLSAQQRTIAAVSSGKVRENKQKADELQTKVTSLESDPFFVTIDGGGPRKRSFCARMSGVKGPMKDSKGRPTRKALALRRWKC